MIKFMKISKNTVLITGGATGIGFSLAEHFLKADNEVIICGRREVKLKEAHKKYPNLHSKPCDITKPDDRMALFDWINSDFSNFNILINNAGIQRAIDLKKGVDGLQGEDEIEVNFKAPIYLTELFIPLLLKQEESAIINVSSGLGFVPIASMPIYCATKAAIHSFTVSLRYQLKDTSIKVFEIIPPTVDTELDKGRRGSYRGIDPSEIGKATLIGVENDNFEITVGESEGLRTVSKENFNQIFSRMNH
jgi:uncharacterized oxidoreductase